MPSRPIVVGVGVSGHDPPPRAHQSHTMAYKCGVRTRARTLPAYTTSHTGLSRKIGPGSIRKHNAWTKSRCIPKKYNALPVAPYLWVVVRVGKRKATAREARALFARRASTASLEPSEMGGEEVGMLQVLCMLESIPKHPNLPFQRRGGLGELSILQDTRTANTCCAASLLFL